MVSFSVNAERNITDQCELKGKRGKAYLPLVYVLTCKKDMPTYETILSVLKETEPRLNPQYIMVDFERATMNAIRLVFPDAKISGCFFHFCQCIYRHVQKYGLQSIYANDADFAQHIRCLAALAFVPVKDVVRHYNSIKQFPFFQQKLKGKTATDLGVQKLLDYMETTYIGQKGKLVLVPGLFPLQLWNVYELTLLGLPRTNNVVEAWHNAIKIMFGINHPNIFKFITGIKTEQDSVEILISKLISQIDLGTHNKKQEEIAQRIYDVVQTYAKTEFNELADLQDYLFGLSSAIHFSNTNSN